MSEKKKDRLFSVDVSFTFVMEADNLEQAENMAHRYARDAFSDLSLYDLDCYVIEGVRAEGWDDFCIPYGGDGKTPTGEYK